MEKNVGLSFDATIKAGDAKKNLHKPIVRKKANTKIDKNKISDLGTLSNLSSEVLVKDLVIDMTYQRFPNENKVNSIVKNFNFDAIGVLICSAREDGTIAVIDGGHRVAALRMLGYEDKSVDCLVYFGLDIAQEAQIFNLMNDSRTKPKTNDLFKAKVVAGDKDAVAISKILDRHGLSITIGPANNAIRAIGTVTSIYKREGVANLNGTISMLANSFDMHSTSFSDSALIAVSKILSVFDKKIDLNRMIATLKAFGSANLWANKGSMISKTMGYKDVNVGMIVCFLNEYNKRLKNNRLEVADIV